MVGEQTYRFPDHTWWVERSKRCDVSDYSIELRPDDAREYGIDAESIVRRIVERVVRKFNPVAVWLFGSIARGDCDKHSDVDLMVIMPDGTDRETAELDIMAELRGSMLPKDIMVDTPDAFRRASDDLGTVQYAVRKYGVMLYG